MLWFLQNDNAEFLQPVLLAIERVSDELHEEKRRVRYVASLSVSFHDSTRVSNAGSVMAILDLPI